MNPIAIMDSRNTKITNAATVNIKAQIDALAILIIVDAILYSQRFSRLTASGFIGRKLFQRVQCFFFHDDDILFAV
jgi:hypothetical protein